MDDSITAEVLLHITRKLVTQSVVRAEDIVRQHSVPEGEGAGESYPLDGELQQLSLRAPRKAEPAAMLLHAYALCQQSLASGNYSQAFVAVMTVGFYLRDAKLVTSLKNAAAEISEGRIGRPSPWNSECTRIATDEFRDRRRRSSKLSDSEICKQIAPIIKLKTKRNIEIGWRGVMANLRNLKVIEPAKRRVNAQGSKVARK